MSKYWVYACDKWTLVDGSCIVHNDSALVPLYSTPPDPPPWNSHSKPPLGLMPEKLWIQKRAGDLCEAIQRYVDAGKAVPSKWIDELYARMREGGMLNETREV